MATDNVSAFPSMLKAEHWSEAASIAHKLGRPVLSCEIMDVTGKEGGFSGDMYRLAVEFGPHEGAPGCKESLMVKVTKPGNTAGSKSLGLVREAIFYRDLMPSFQLTEKDEHEAHDHHKKLPHGFLWPKVFFADVDESAGVKCIVMSDLSAEPFKGTQAGYFFGPGSPINWGKDLAKLTENFPNVTEQDVSFAVFEGAAVFHARYWHDAALTESPLFSCLRGRRWLLGEDRESWQASIDYAVGAWNRFKDAYDQDVDKKKEANGYTLHPELRKIIDAAYAKVNFEDYVKEARKHSWTLVHGDFHPGNFLVVRDPVAPPSAAAKSVFRVVAVDWEAVGLGNGPQELAQWLISHSAPEHRRQYEQEGVKRYHAVLASELKRRGSTSTPSFDQMLSEYVSGGVGRWLWMLPVCLAVCPQKTNQYFHDQLHTFLRDHNINAENVCFPRP